MNTHLEILNPHSSTGFLLRNAAGAGQDLLIDMAGLSRSLDEHESKTKNIRHLLLTHFHSDHLSLTETLKLANTGTRIHIGRRTWQEFSDWLTDADRPGEERALYERIEESGRLEFLDPHGTMALGDREVTWATFKHGNGDYECTNLTFRVDDVLFTGDTSALHLFNPDIPGSGELLGLHSGGRVRILCINIAQISREEINGNPDLEPRRRRNYLHNHGILEDVVDAIADETLASFWRDVQIIVPHHIRRQPLPETATQIANKLMESGRSICLRFVSRFPAMVAGNRDTNRKQIDGVRPITRL